MFDEKPGVGVPDDPQGKTDAFDEGIAFAQRKSKDKAEPKRTTSRNGAVLFSAVVFLLGCVVGLALGWLLSPGPWAVIAGLVVGAVCAMCVHVTMQWERAVVMRLGKFNRVAGPGVYFTIPIIEFTTSVVDQRMRCTYFSGERILTADLVPVDVDAVFFWTVWDPRQACTEVENYESSVSRTAQACMRDVIGSMEIEEMATRRAQIDAEIRDQIATITEQWGVSVATVKIRNIIIPEELQDAMSKAAQAQRERDARVILAEVERDISAMLVEAANEYDANEHAMQLRAMHAVNDSVREHGGMIVVPSSLGDSFGNAADFLKRL